MPQRIETASTSYTSEKIICRIKEIFKTDINNFSIFSCEMKYIIHVSNILIVIWKTASFTNLCI